MSGNQNIQILDILKIKKQVKFQIDSRSIADILEDYNPSIKREMRQLKSMGVIDYEPIEEYSTIWLFKTPKRKTCTYQSLYKSFMDGLEEVKNPVHSDSAAYKIREMLKRAKQTN